MMPDSKKEADLPPPPEGDKHGGDMAKFFRDIEDDQPPEDTSSKDET